MSEEEIIKILQEIIQKNQQVIKEAYKNKDINTMQLVADIDNEAIAIQGILDLYNKEKEKNKELENADLTTVYMNGFYDGEKKWKDKIKNKIEDYTEKSKMPLVNPQSRREYTFGIRAFQNLLQEK